MALRDPERETRVALVPEVVAQIVRKGLRVVIQVGAGAGALQEDDAYRAVGAEVVSGRELAAELSRAQALVHVQPLDPVRIAALPAGMITVGLTGGHGAATGHTPRDADGEAMVEALNAARITALSFERLPRTSRAQAMDVLSSQAFTAGYRAVLRSEEHTSELQSRG